MAGELYRGAVQVGREVTPGTAVAATRKMYYTNPSLVAEREGRFHKFATGTRDNQRAFTNGPQAVSGTLEQPLSADEIVELLLAGIRGGVASTQPDSVGAPSVRLWTFTPGNTLDALTVEWDDGARPWRAAGCHVDSLKFSGSANGEAMVSADLFGRSLIQNALTGALTDRVPTFIEGWETKLYIDAAGGVPGTTNIAGTLINWEVTIANGLTRKYFADNVNAAGGVVAGELSVEATLTFEASPAASLTEFNNWVAVTRRLVRLEFGQNSTIATTFKRFVTIDIPGAWSAVKLSGDDEGTRTYELSLGYVYDSVLAAGVQVRAQNDRATAF